LGGGALQLGIVTDIDHGERGGRTVRVGILQKPAQKNFFGTLEVRFAEEKKTEQQHHQHDQNLEQKPEWRSLHWAEVNGKK
jgi:hypothetical protein